MIRLEGPVAGFGTPEARQPPLSSVLRGAGVGMHDHPGRRAGAH